MTALEEPTYPSLVEPDDWSEELQVLLGAGTLVTVANRLPCCWPPSEDHLVPTPGGLASTLLPVARRSGATWVGSVSAGADQEPVTIDDIRLVPVPLSAEEETGYYAGFANAGIWPLYHDALRPSRFSRAQWNHYVTVNRRFADAAIAEAGPASAVWVHDYHLQLVPRFIRSSRPTARIGFFLHIPFPHPALFRRLPWRMAILSGLLGADLIGFQDTSSAENFKDCCAQLGLGTVAGDVVHHSHGSTTVGTFPVATDGSIFDEISRSPSTELDAAALRRHCGNPELLLLGVDRLDYTKGIDIRLRAYEMLLRSGRIDPQTTVFLQVAPPSRTDVREYQAEQARIEQAVARINGRYGSTAHQPVLYLNQSMSTSDLVAAYRAADVMLVTPLRDGMNLVAKEYVASQYDHRGSLVLSEFAGAAVQLGLAHIVNPYDLPSVAAGILDAVSMDPAQARQRMQQMRETVMAESPQQWAQGFLSELAVHAQLGAELRS